MKKILFILFCFIFPFSFSACSNTIHEEKYELIICDVNLSPWVKEITEDEAKDVNGEAYYCRRENDAKLSEIFPWNTFGKHRWEAEKVIDILSNIETTTSIESVDQTTCDDYYIYTIGIDLVDRMDEKAYKTPSNLQSFHFIFWNDFNYIGYYHDDVGKPIKIDDTNVSNIFIVDNPDYIKQVFIDKELYVE